MKRFLLPLILIVMTGASSRAGGQAAAAVVLPKVQLPAELVRKLDPVIDAMWSGFDRGAAMGHVEFVSGYWRTAGNDGFEASLDRVRKRLADSGFSEGKRTDRASQWTEEFPNNGHGWQYTVGTLALIHPGGQDEVVLSRERQRLALCINSFSTPSTGVEAPLVDVGRGDRDQDYDGKSIQGAVVIGDADINNLWRRAVVAKGALGVISTALGNYVNPDPPGARATPRESWEILQWGSVPYDEGKHGFGFKSTPHAAAILRHALANGAAHVRVTVASAFTNKPEHTLVAEIPGSTVPDERIVVVAHVQEPGANDNASGVTTLVELVRALEKGIESRNIPRPQRTLTFLWGDENTASRQWIRDHPAEAKKVKYMFSMDMPGEDVTKTGGSFLIERWPDPGAVWDRPWDPHTEWGRGNVRAESLNGDLINDLHLAVCERVALKGHWLVHTNPYEGGSDHTVFGTAGVPSVLDWHFTDRYYHTNMDTPDKTSPDEMRNVAVSVAATAWLMASADASTVAAVGDLVANAGRQRIAFEEEQGRKLVDVAADRGSAQQLQNTIVQAWRKWYDEAGRSVSRLRIPSQAE